MIKRRLARIDDPDALHDPYDGVWWLGRPIAEPTLLLANEIRDLRMHRTIVQAIVRGAPTLSAISAFATVQKI